MTSKICLVGLVGRNPEWINRSIYDLKPDIVILIASTSEDEHPDRDKFPEDKYPRVTYLDYAEETKNFVYDFYKKIDMNPPKIKIIPVENPRDLGSLFTILRTIIEYYLDRDYEIYINIASGLRPWQLFSYYIAMMLEDERVKVFSYDKERKEQIVFPTFTLTKTEQQILNLIAEGYTKPGEILRGYISRIAKRKKVTLAMISKYLGELKRKGLIISIGKEYKLTDLGKILSEKIEVKKFILERIQSK